MDPETTSPAPKNLVTKLAEVMKEVGRIPKNGTNTHFNYKFVRESDLVDKLSELLGARHIFITSVMKGFEPLVLPNKTCVLLRVEYTFRDGDTGETLTVDSFGEVEQDGGKGIYKALTGAMKYFLMKQFLVATGDDPEDEKKPRDDRRQEQRQPAPPKPQPPKMSVQNAMEGITACPSKVAVASCFSGLFRHPWTPEEKAKLNECYLNSMARVTGATLSEDKTYFADREGQVMATVGRSKDGWAVIVKPEPKSEPVETAAAVQAVFTSDSSNAA